MLEQRLGNNSSRSGQPRITLIWRMADGSCLAGTSFSQKAPADMVIGKISRLLRKVEDRRRLDQQTKTNIALVAEYGNIFGFDEHPSIVSRCESILL